MRTRNSTADPAGGGEDEDDYERRVRQAPARPPPRRDDDPRDRPAPPPPPRHSGMPPQPPPRREGGEKQQAPNQALQRRQEAAPQPQQPPPPPPPEHEEPPINNNNNNNNSKDRWILQVRRPRRRSVRRIQVHADMDAATLASCLRQALELRGADGGGDPVMIAGLFQEGTETFLPLERIVRLSAGDHQHADDDDDDNARQRDLIYAVELPERHAPPRRKRSWWEREWILCAAIPLASLWVAHRHSRDVLHWIESGVRTAYHVAFERPLRETYRGGPWFLGWEGEPLPRICARITFHGDEAFWERNMGECQRIFDAKEQAWLRLARPAVGLLAAALAVWALRLLIREWRRHHHARERPVDRDMADLFRAFTVITRQIHRVTAEQQARYQQQQNFGREDQLRRR